MKLLKRILKIAGAILLILIVVGSLGGGWFITKSHPQIDGTIRVDGLKSKVEVVRDPMGVPHIYADNVDDLMFAQGYVEAQDRLWQMEYNRRIGHGTLSEMFGATTIKTDRFLRTMGLGRAARADYAALTADDKRPLEAFARGVNAFTASHRDNLPLEFTILGVAPAAWEPVDTIAWGKVMAYNLGGNYDAELLRAGLIEKIGEAKTKELTPPYPASGPFIIPPEAKEYKAQVPNYQIPNPKLPITNYQSPSTHYSIGTPNLAELREMDAALVLRVPEVGSNNWVVDGSKSATGKPLLANDPHLGIQMPSIWYQMGLHCVPQNDACPLNVVGFTFPGVPGIVIGHNDRIAWGVTNVGPDVQDLFIEKVNPQNPNQFEYQGKWEDAQVVGETIKIKGGTLETLKVQITRHGPIMTPVLTGVTQPLALQWTALRERSRLFESVQKYDRARNWEEFRAALKLFDVPSQNFVYADVDGNIGYQTPGNIPIRAKGDGTVPVPGWTGEYEWKTYIPFDELPFVYNPPTHFVATANNAVVPPTYKYLIALDFAAPYRQQRIVDLLKAKEKLTIDDFKAIQGDVYSIPLAQFQKFVAALSPQGTMQQRALDAVKAWDGKLTLDNVGGTIVEATYARLIRNMFTDKIPDKDVLNSYLGANDTHRRVVLALLDQPKSEWWGSAGRDALLQKSFAEAVDSLGQQFGDAPADWKWSRLHTATFNHPLGSVQPLNLLFNAGPIPAPGGVNTVFNTSFRFNSPYAVGTVSSLRQIVDLSNFANSVSIHTTGESGQPLNKHYNDMVPLWRDVQYAPYYFDRAALDKVKEGLLILQP